MKKKDNKEKKNITFMDIINSPRTVIIFMICFMLALVFWVLSLNNKIKFYTGQISSDDLAIAEVVYYTDHKLTYLFANNAVYSGEDKEIYKFKIKYVVEIDGKENVIEEFETSFDEKQSLKTMILAYSKFKVVDLKTMSKQVFTKEMKDNIKNLKLVINASTKKDSDYDINLKYDVQLEKVN